MPVQTNLPEYYNASSVEDISKYHKYSFALTAMEAAMFPEWQLFNKLFGTIPWKPNMGSELKGIRPEYTPVSEMLVYPNTLQTNPTKNVYETYEMSEACQLHWHDFDSNLFHFLPSFQDFRENQLDFNHKDIVRQVAIFNENFILTNLWHRTPHVYLPGNTAGDNLVVDGVPWVDGSTALTDGAANQKGTAWLANILPQIGEVGAQLATLDHAVSVLRDDIGAPYFEGMVNTPKDDETIKGRYAMVCSAEVRQMFKYDPNLQNWRDRTSNILNKDVQGVLFDELSTKIVKHPMRFAVSSAGAVTIPAPEITLLVDQNNPKRAVRRPNPAWVNAQYEVIWLLGADACKTVKVGPPPKAFAGKMSKEKFYSLRWNGEVTLTDQILLQYNNAGTIVYDTNVRGRYLKFISSLTMGYMPCNRWAALPIIIKRRRPTAAAQ